MMLGPPHRFCKILISRLIFFFFTGFRILTQHRDPLTTLTPSKTCAGAAAEAAMAARTRNAFGARRARRARTHARSAAALTSLYLPRPILRMTS
jgi:hypothetical protein